MLTRSPRRRLSGDGVLKHPFFFRIDWRTLNGRQVPPPLVPETASDTDLRYFDRTFTREPARLSPEKESALGGAGDEFSGFTYLPEGELAGEDAEALLDGMGSAVVDEDEGEV